MLNKLILSIALALFALAFNVKAVAATTAPVLPPACMLQCFGNSIMEPSCAPLDNACLCGDSPSYEPVFFPRMLKCLPVQCGLGTPEIKQAANYLLGWCQYAESREMYATGQSKYNYTAVLTPFLADSTI
ncbi:hypothetical protein T439DRAFT_353007 [Meredithblackwellia eburnea MCA 4105]